MNKFFLEILGKNCGFPSDAVRELGVISAGITSLGEELAFNEIVGFFHASGYEFHLTDERIEALSARTGVHKYSLWLLLLIMAAERAKLPYRQGVVEYVFWDSFSDLRCKALECKEIHGFYGTFVTEWYPEENEVLYIS